MIKDKIEKLTNELIAASDSYYNSDTTTMSDREFDMKIEELRELEKEYPKYVLPNSPTQTVGSATKSTFEKVHHSHPMLSLDNSYNSDEVDLFVERVRKLVSPRTPYTYSVEPKYDGVSISLVYVNSKLSKAITRGNGIVGEDVTENVKCINDIPKVLLEEGKNIEVRGEILLSNENFNILNERRKANSEPTYMNPRNTVSGTLRLHDLNEVRARNLESRIYFMYEDSEFISQIDILAFLRRLGFNTGVATKAYNAKEIHEIIKNFKNQRKDLSVATDGMVIKINEVTLWDEIGYTGRSPRWAIAYKYETEQQSTRLNKITWQVGRTGKITPVANFDPIILAGTCVNRSTLHNFDYIKLKDIREGDMILVEKSAEIIPQVLGPLKELRTGSEIPTPEPIKCPVCGHKLEIIDGKVDIFCINVMCDARIALRFEHLSSRNALNIMGMGPSIVASYLERELLNPNDLMSIYSLIEKLADSPFAVDRGIRKSLIESLDREPTGLLYGLGITGMGRSNSALVLESLGSIERVFDASQTELMNLVGKVNGRTAYNIIHSDTFDIDHILGVLRKYGVKTEMGDKKISGPLTGEVIVLTGVFDVSRSIIEDEIRALGGIIGSSVNRDTTYLFTGDKPSASKVSKAVKLSVNVIKNDTVDDVDNNVLKKVMKTHMGVVLARG